MKRILFFSMILAFFAFQANPASARVSLQYSVGSHELFVGWNNMAFRPSWLSNPNQMLMPRASYGAWKTNNLALTHNVLLTMQKYENTKTIVKRQLKKQRKLADEPKKTAPKITIKKDKSL